MVKPIVIHLIHEEVNSLDEIIIMAFLARTSKRTTSQN